MWNRLWCESLWTSLCFSARFWRVLVRTRASRESCSSVMHSLLVGKGNSSPPLGFFLGSVMADVSHLWTFWADPGSWRFWSLPEIISCCYVFVLPVGSDSHPRMVLVLLEGSTPPGPISCAVLKCSTAERTGPGYWVVLEWTDLIRTKSVWPVEQNQHTGADKRTSWISAFILFEFSFGCSWFWPLEVLTCD